MRIGSLIFAILLLAAPTWAQAPSNAVAAERLVLQYSAGQFILVSRTPVRKVLPAEDLLPPSRTGHSGFWYELRAGDGSVRYRRIIANPVIRTFEGPDPDAAGPMPPPVRVAAITDGTVFSLLLPAVQSGDVLLLFSSPLVIGEESAPASQVGQINFEPIIH